MWLKNAIVISFIFILSSDIVERLSGINLISNGTYIGVFLKTISLYGIGYTFFYSRWQDKIPKIAFLTFQALIIWNIITIFRGGLYATSYWDWKFLLCYAVFLLLMPASIVIGVMFVHCSKLFNILLNKLFAYGWVVLIIALVVDLLLFPRIMTPLTLFVLFIPYLTRKWQVIVFGLATISAVLVIGYRANFLRLTTGLLLSISFFYRNIFLSSVFKVMAVILFIAPLILLSLGITGQFNVFELQDSDEILIEGNNGNTENLAADTRTFLYVEVFQSMSQHNSFLFGEGGAAKYDSEFFDLVGENGRYGAEVGFLNTLLYSGILGVLLYGIILATASYYALVHSNNYLSKMLGLFVALRWVVFFIEDINKFDMNIYFLWICVGLCLSNHFRSLADEDIKNYFKFVYNDN